MVKRGKGLEAFQQTVKGGLNAVVAAAVIALPLFYLLQSLYTFISGFMEFILLFFLFFIIVDSENLLYSVVVVLFSGALGVISFQSGVNQQFVLIPIFSGLFAVPGIYSILSTDFSIPEQDLPETSLLEFSGGGIAGAFAGLLAGTVPGIGAAVSTSFFTPLLDHSRKQFLAAMGAVNTSDIIFSILTLQIIGKARSGVSVAVKALSTPSTSQLLFLAALTVLSVILSASVAVKVSRKYHKIIEYLELQKVLYAVIATVLVSTFALTGFQGILVLCVSSLIGFAAVETDTRRSCMAVLIVPSIIFFAQISIFM